MKRSITYFLLIIFASFSAAAPAAFSYHSRLPEGKWEERKSTHYIIYYRPDVPDKYVREFTDKCERYYRSITVRLGFNRFDFWLWEDRARVFIYGTREEYVKSTGRAEWSGASVHVKEKSISTFYFEKGFFDVILPHELSHIILKEFIGLKRRVPLWFDEGVACANEKDSLVRYLLVTRGLVEKKLYMPVPELEKISAENLIVPGIFYPASASLVIFILEDYGRNRFVEFCRELRDGNTFYGAMKKVYDIRDAEDLNEKFLKYLNGKSYEEIVNSENFSVAW